MSLVAAVNLVSSWPEQLKAAAVSGLRAGGRNVCWQDWPTEYRGGDTVSYYEPSEADVAARPYLLVTLSLQFTVPSAELPEPPVTPASLLDAGQQAVAVVAAELNPIVGPVLNLGFGGGSPAPEVTW